MLRTGFDIKITILDGNNGQPANKLAEAELVFKDGALEAPRWRASRSDTFSARKGKKGYWDFLRCASKNARKTMTDFILAEFRREVKAAEAREAAGATA